ncbi:MAG: hypothetical protein GXP31_19580 [Kiritimatiellaeota bacterium]|nr:hypothetical protein [Kiritimatiellota bacterium]
MKFAHSQFSGQRFAARLVGFLRFASGASPGLARPVNPVIPVGRSFAAISFMAAFVHTPAIQTSERPGGSARPVQLTAKQVDNIVLKAAFEVKPSKVRDKFRG